MSSLRASNLPSSGRPRRGHSAALVALIVATLITMATPAVAKRVALVIGNATYQDATAPIPAAQQSLDKPQRLKNLSNPVRDARAVAAELTANGFTVTAKYDLDHDDFVRVIRDFTEAADGATEVVVFFAGHGMKVTRREGRQVKEFNILAPIDARISCDTKDDSRVIEMDKLMRAVEGVPKQVFIFDSCRDDPFQHCPGRTAGATGSGFDRAALPVSAQSAQSIIVAYSTGDGKVASDGVPDKNSPFAEALLKEMRDKKHYVFRELLELTSEQVATATSQRQIPAVVGTGSKPDMCLAGSYCLTTAALVTNIKQAEQNLQMREAHFLARVAEDFLKEGKPVEAALIALEGMPDLTEPAAAGRPFVSELSGSLARSLPLIREQRVLSDQILLPTSAAFSPDGRRVVTGSLVSAARLWDAVDGRMLTELKGHGGPVNSAAFSLDGRRIVTASQDKTARLWDAADGREIVQLKGHADDVKSAAFSPDGRRVVTASDDNTARIWDAADGREQMQLKGHGGKVISAAFSPDGRRIVTASDDNTARLWDSADGREIVQLKGHAEMDFSAAFSPDGGRIVTASIDRTARLWDAADGREIVQLNGHADRVRSAAFSPDGRRIVTASDDGTARLWDAADGRQLIELRGHTGALTSAAFSPDGRRIVTASWDGTARLWDAVDGRQLLELKGHVGTVIGGTVNSAAFSPDGRRIVTASWDKTARLWDAADGRMLLELKGHGGRVMSAAFSPDGRRIVTASQDKTARLWDAADGREIVQLKGHADDVKSAAFSPDGRRVVTASDDTTARLWDATDGREIVQLKGHSGSVWSAAFSPDGRRIVTASDDKSARLWDAPVSTQAFVSEAKRLVPRCLTEAQRTAIYIAAVPPRPAWCDTLKKWPYDAPTDAIATATPAARP